MPRSPPKEPPHSADHGEPNEPNGTHDRPGVSMPLGGHLLTNEESPAQPKRRPGQPGNGREELLLREEPQHDVPDEEQKDETGMLTDLLLAGHFQHSSAFRISGQSMGLT